MVHCVYVTTHSIGEYWEVQFVRFRWTRMSPASQPLYISQPSARIWRCTKDKCASCSNVTFDRSFIWLVLVPGCLQRHSICDVIIVASNRSPVNNRLSTNKQSSVMKKTEFHILIQMHNRWTCCSLLPGFFLSFLESVASDEHNNAMHKHATIIRHLILTTVNYNTQINSQLA